ncbi:MAG: helix-turn-helix domain-containing protein [Candidatus Ornithomonoglobus sp.]
MKNLHKIRTERKMSQLALSMKLGISQETISAYENGKSFPSVDILLKMCDIFNVSADYLLDRTNITYFINDTLSDDEAELIARFRQLPHPLKNRAIGIIIGMSSE